MHRVSEYAMGRKPIQALLKNSGRAVVSVVDYDGLEGPWRGYTEASEKTPKKRRVRSVQYRIRIKLRRPFTEIDLTRGEVYG